MATLEEVLAVAERYARKRLGRDDERAHVAVVLAWYHWRLDAGALPASCYARSAVRHAMAGRDLPGIRTSHGKDAMDRDVWLSGHMTEVRDSAPGPERVAAWKEELAQLRALLTLGERDLVEAVQDGVYRTLDLAAALGLSPGRVSQLRRQLAEKCRE